MWRVPGLQITLRQLTSHWMMGTVIGIVYAGYCWSFGFRNYSLSSVFQFLQAALSGQPRFQRGAVCIDRARGGVQAIPAASRRAQSRRRRQRLRLGDRAPHCALAWWRHHAWRFAARRITGGRARACLSKVFYLRCKSLAARARTSNRPSVASASASFSRSAIPRARRQRLTRSPSAVRRLRTTSARSRFCLR